MKILIAPQQFKGSLPAYEVAEAMAKGVKAVSADIETVLLPFADGGFGTVRALVQATGGRPVVAEAGGPLGDAVQATWGILGDGRTAVIEMSAASGLDLIAEEQHNPMLTSTYGTGQLIKAALDAGISDIIIGLGDSATVDGGLGMAEALGYRLFDENGQPLQRGGAGLARLRRIDSSGRHPRLGECRIIGASDVTNPLYGPDGAACVYGPQKGATDEMVAALDAGLRNYAAIIKRDLGIEVAKVPGAGAAGGLGAGLVAFLEATLRPGIDIVCDAVGLESQLAGADLVITGEGRIDFQTAFGKTAAGIAKRAKTVGVPVVAVCGELGPGYADVYKHGINAVTSILPRCMDKAEAMREAANLVAGAAERMMRLFLAGRGGKI